MPNNATPPQQQYPQQHQLQMKQHQRPQGPTGVAPGKPALVASASVAPVPSQVRPGAPTNRKREAPQPAEVGGAPKRIKSEIIKPESPVKPANTSPSAPKTTVVPVPMPVKPEVVPPKVVKPPEDPVKFGPGVSQYVRDLSFSTDLTPCVDACARVTRAFTAWA